MLNTEIKNSINSHSEKSEQLCLLPTWVFENPAASLATTWQEYSSLSGKACYKYTLGMILGKLLAKT